MRRGVLARATWWAINPVAVIAASAAATGKSAHAASAAGPGAAGQGSPQPSASVPATAAAVAIAGRCRRSAAWRARHGIARCLERSQCDIAPLSHARSCDSLDGREPVLTGTSTVAIGAASRDGPVSATPVRGAKS